MARKSRSATHRSPRRRASHGDRRLIAASTLIIAIAAASIGAMLALHLHVADETREVTARDAGETATASPELPIYEEPVESAALEPAPPAEPPTIPKVLPAPIEVLPSTPPEAPAWQRNAVVVAGLAQDPRPRIAVVIDDLGFDRERGNRVMELPGPLTVAFLPYADNLDRQSEQARKAGHELLVHMPMDPRNRKITDPGPNALLVDLAPDELRRRIDWNLSQFDGYVGINNHMGSRFTADAEGLAEVMVELKHRGLLFLDSRTSGRTVVGAVARAVGVPSVSRDVFIDHIRTAEAVQAALAEVERIARRQGHAIAIGHPRDITIDALRSWLPQLEAKGFRLVPVSALVREAYVDH